MRPRLINMGDQSTVAEIGGKAHALARLAATDETIPAWFAISADCGEVDDVLRGQIDARIRAICPDGRPVAVRSSAVEEDGAESSFAGQFESHLDVPHERVVERIMSVRAGAQSERVLAYRSARGLDGGAHTPAVLVQRMVRADFAGVAFAADPVSGDRERAVVAVVRGLGEALVSGERDADTFTVDFARDPGGAIVKQELALEQSGVPMQIVMGVAALARRVSDRFGAPQDIEFAIESGTIHLLQSRPITTLRASRSTPGAERTLWDNSNIVESYGGIVTPLTFSFARRAYEEVYRAFCRVMAVPEATIESSGHVYANMLGFLNGRVYYNMLNWYRLLAMLPGFRYNRRFMEQMMGVSEALSAELADAVGIDAKAVGGAGVSAPPSLADRARMLRSVVRMIGNHWTLPRRIDAFNRRLAEALHASPESIGKMTAVELVSHCRALEPLMGRWDAPVVNDFLAMVFHGLLRSLCVKWVDPDESGLHNDLTRDIGGVISTEPATMLRDMAQAAAQDPSLIALLQDGAPGEGAAALRGHAILGPMYETYLRRFADRCLEELKLESPTLEDDPTPLLRSVGHAAARSRDGHVVVSREREILERAYATVGVALGRHPLRRIILKWVIRNARDRMRDRENLRFERTRIFGRMRRIMVELGSRLATAGEIVDARDVFMLEVDEVLGFVEGTTTTVDLRALVALRAAQQARFVEMSLPDRFETVGTANPVVASARDREVSTSDAAPDASVRSGIGCCAGVVRGRARVIRDPRGAELHPGEILVAERTDPGWVMIFPAAAGVLVERGSLLSHSAIVSRELGIPGVVSIPGLTAWLRDGDEIELDGASGRVRLIGRAGGGAPMP